MLGAIRGSNADDRSARMAASLVREWLAAGHAMWVPIVGASMAPFLSNGSRIEVIGVTPGALRVGELVVYESAGRMICHRVVRRRHVRGRVALLTRGDAWRGRGRWIADRQVIGKVVAVERRGRHRRVDSPAGRAAALALGLLVWMRGRALEAVSRVRWMLARTATA